jgi:radical SAM superfamily enzyme YgiQ (UPF0313 family)
LKILLVNPNSQFLISEKVFPSLGLLYLSSYLKEHGYKDVRLLDMNDELPLPGNIEADIVGIYSNTPQYPTAVSLLHKIREINVIRDAVYAMGGPHVSGKPEDAAGEADVVVIGEGERALLDIVRRRESGLPHEKIVRCEYMHDLDAIPYPDRDIIDIKSYKYYLDGRLTTTLITSRGCPFGCNFCANNAWGKSLRLASAEKVYGEVKLLRDKYGYKAFMFFDDTMTVNRRRMLDICGLLKKLDIIYRCFIRSDTVDMEVLKAMRGSGCVEVGIGLESGSPRILKIVNKGETVEKNLQAVKMCHSVGIRVKGFLIVGLPGENKESVAETMAFLDKAQLDDMDISIYTPYPGSYIYRHREDFDIKFNDDYEHAWYKGKPGEYRSLVSTSSLSSADILAIRNRIEAEYKNKDLLDVPAS